ncbi:MAG: hypothetical protein IT327_07745 [Anaerolineae bacterium]|nr:hypothetical protein [Anaerolineae bacterium]
MDTFRWSDGHSHETEFQAQENGFIEPAMEALKTFHAETAKKYHDGETQTVMIHFRQAELHIQVNGNWRPLHHNGALVIFPITAGNTPESIAEIYDKLETELLFKQRMIWRRVDTAYDNERNLIQFIHGVSDTLKRMTDEENDESNNDTN